MPPDPTIVAAARNLAAWHDSSTRALGLHPGRDESWWACPMSAPTIYFSAISQRPATRTGDLLAALRAQLERPDFGVVSVCDAWAELDLGSLGLQRRATGSWYRRPPLPAPSVASTDLVVDLVRTTDELAELEAVVLRGFGARPTVAPFDVHAPGILDDPRMQVLGGRLPDGTLVAGAMSYDTGDVLGIYGVTTLPEHRACGYATTMTAAALAAQADRPATLQPSLDAASLYRRLGFVSIGEHAHWA